MRVLVFVTAGLLASGLGIKHFQNQPDLSSPKSTVMSLVDAYGRRDFDGMAKCIDGGVSWDLAKGYLPTYLRFTSAKGTETMVEVNGDSARVAVEYEVSVTADGTAAVSTISGVDMFTLKKGGAGWQIEAETLGSASTDPAIPLLLRPLQLLVALLGPDPGYRNAVEAATKQAQAAACQANINQDALGVLMYAQDYDERMPRSAAGYNKLIFPYVRNDALFHCAADAKSTISYNMNTDLQNRMLRDIPNPARTVLLYEGQGGVVNYRHEGKAAIAFADGNAKLMTEAEVKQLIWKLPPPAPQKPVKKNKR